MQDTNATRSCMRRYQLDQAGRQLAGGRPLQQGRAQRASRVPFALQRQLLVGLGRLLAHAAGWLPGCADHGRTPAAASGVQRPEPVCRNTHRSHSKRVDTDPLRVVRPPHVTGMCEYGL